MLLPYFGSSPNVWNTCMFFFQGILLLGYYYSHKSSTIFRLSTQTKIHTLLLGITLFFLPVQIPSYWSPGPNTNPIFVLVLLMTITILFPFLLLSCNAPLLQKWVSQTTLKENKNPYYLYAASNSGSLLALLAYPFIIEPNFKLLDQSKLWMYFYWVYCVLLILCAITANKSFNKEHHSEDKTTLNFKQKLYWIFLSFIPSSMLLGVTTYITVDISPIPLLWIIPLLIYLLSFIIVFSKTPLFRHELMLKILPITILCTLVSLISANNTNIIISITLHLFNLFICAMVCHGELVKHKPNIKYLTDFYLCISIGGFLGGLFNTLIAPIVFKTLFEYPLIIILSCTVLPFKDKVHGMKKYILDIILPIGIFAFIYIFSQQLTTLKINSALITNLIIIGFPLLSSLMFIKRPIRFGLYLLAIFISIGIYTNRNEKTLFIGRTFFGTNKVTLSKDSNFHNLLHGKTVHGIQNLKKKDLPQGYYSHSSPIGQLFLNKNNLNSESQIGVIGLGSGALAAYGYDNQKWTFFEIDKQVASIAQNKKYFSYLNDAKIKYKIIIGDGRLSLDKEQNNKYDLLIVDAFSSDSIPTHFLTKEMIKIYLSKITNTGIIAFHISNQYLNLEPVLAGLVKESQIEGFVQNDLSKSQEEISNGAYGSSWVILAQNKETANLISHNQKWKPIKLENSILWSDDYSNLFKILKWKT